ncbi:hypothetical protein N7539_000989 [Penicillium diatomitis]|uniref:Pheromone-regulated membrane protein n=1 Tax=Penicillium diatomitis TaxID=2819901 RepID=A0A9W9XMR7_9EURO|nr:uncharacterized protein N7539_000989 [Penicillium diatomitis]KAJ5495873.1 hypothetical protein N7539_000989 [Penicillium diatomitis]
MPCGGDREKGTVSMEEKWDYVNLNDFKADSCWTGFSYFFLWVFLLISIAVYGTDTFTAVNLLAFSRWSGRVEPAIPFHISRWIFAGCILLSFALLIYRWISAIRAIRSGSITRSYLDPLAVRVQCFRVFTREGRGWRRFLVFAELTKSKKGAEYVALYAYFSFESWLSILFADGPRQVINAITLWSVMQADLLPGGKNAPKDNGSGEAWQFFNNVKILAEGNNLQAVVLFGMLFTLIIWVLSILRLASAVVLYLIFLFHHIPSTDGSLKVYCRRKISTRLTRIVRKKVDKALANGFKMQNRAPTHPTVAGGAAAKPTLPSLPDVNREKPMASPTLSRSTTQTTLPPYTRSNSTAVDKHPTLPTLELDSKPPLTRTVTQSSAISDGASFMEPSATTVYSPLDHQTASLPPVPLLPPNLPTSRTPGAEWRQPSGPPPMSREFGTGTPGPGMRNLTDTGPRSYTPYGPDGDASNRLRTPGASVRQRDHEQASTGTASPARYNPYGEPLGYYGAPPEDGYMNDETPVPGTAQVRPQHTMTGSTQGHSQQDQWSSHPYSPAHQQETVDPFSDQQRNPLNGDFAVAPQLARSTTPANTSMASRTPPNRSMTPASHRGTPGPQPGRKTPGPMRTYTPFNPTDAGHPQSAYEAFTPNPEATQPSPASAGDPSIGYRAFTPNPEATQPSPASAGDPSLGYRAFTPNPEATQPSPASAGDPSLGYRAFSPLSNGIATAPTGSPSGPHHSPAGYQAFNPIVGNTDADSTEHAHSGFHTLDSVSDTATPTMASPGDVEPGYRPFSPASNANHSTRAGSGDSQSTYQAFSPIAHGNASEYGRATPMSRAPQTYEQTHPYPPGPQYLARAQTASPSTMSGYRHGRQPFPPGHDIPRAKTSQY